MDSLLALYFYRFRIPVSKVFLSHEQETGTIKKMTHELRQFIKKRRPFIWYVRDPSRLSEDAVVEAVLNNGNWDDVQRLIRILGIKKLASIFRSRIRKKRSNYHPKIAHYFKLYFQKHAR